MSIETLSRSLAFGSGLDLESIQRLWEVCTGHGHTPTAVTSFGERARVAYFFHDPLGNGLRFSVPQMKGVENEWTSDFAKSHLGLYVNLRAEDISLSL